MSKRVITIVGLVVLVSILVGAAFSGTMHYIERQRIADATPAFRPLERLGVLILSQPIAFHRYCRYVLEFGDGADISDDNIEELTSLNSLPPQNTLDVVIKSPDVTDQSLPVLLSLATVDVLDVTATSISDAGISQLRERFPERIVPERKGSRSPTSRGRKSVPTPDSLGIQAHYETPRRTNLPPGSGQQNSDLPR